MRTYVLRLNNHGLLSRRGTLTLPRVTFDPTDVCRFPTVEEAQRVRGAWATHQERAGFPATCEQFTAATIEQQHHTEGGDIFRAWADLNATAPYVLPLFIEDAPSYLFRVAESGTVQGVR